MDHVRPPDETKTERLVFPEEDELLRFVMEQSAKEYEQERNMREERQTHFVSIKRKFQQFQQIDKPNESFYRFILSAIESYESGATDVAQVGEDVYAQLIATLDRMRIHPDEKSRLLAFII
jgi:hypothetical protein